ncbi:MAG TPA: DUF1080 domain-containing protein [Methylomirabilota bacterium]|nr:DUF1080 domain-containing protein [Methylomirabilota bacterium]
MALPFALAIVATSAEAPSRHHPLFNGTNLAGWTTWLVDTKHADPRAVFTVTNGAIHISGDGLGYLATTNNFRDYKLTIEFKWGATNTHWGDRTGKARDSGVFLHAVGPHGNSDDGRGAFMAAIECNIFEGATGDFLLIRGTNANGAPIVPRISFLGSPRRDADGFRWFQPDGERYSLERWGRANWIRKSAAWRDQFSFRGEHDIEKSPGEWNRLEMTCESDRIRVELNGILVNEAFDVFPLAGKILLQCEGSEIFFRRVELQPLRR